MHCDIMRNEAVLVHKSKVLVNLPSRQATDIARQSYMPVKLECLEVVRNTIGTLGSLESAFSAEGRRLYKWLKSYILYVL